MAIVDKKVIDEFYSKKKIAIIGASRQNAKYGRMLFEELKARGFEVIPVNPNAEEIGKVKAFKSVKDIPGGVEAAIAVVPPAELEKVTLEAAQAGVKYIWMHEHVMKGVSNPKAIYLAEEKGMTCIVGFCPMMFMPKAGFPHNIHGAIMKMFGAWPK